MAEIQVGDTVKLKSGGPKMTVREYFPKGEWDCQWFVGRPGNQELRTGSFPAESLGKVDPA